MNQKIFLITPYEVDSDFLTKKEIVKKCCLRFGFDLLLAESDNSGNPQSLDAEQTIERFREVDFFIADLSHERPSCYFEVGYVQSAKKNVCLIAKLDTLIHQVANRTNVKFYKDLKEYEELITLLISEFK